MKKLGFLLLILSLGSFALFRWGGRALPGLQEFMMVPNQFGLATALQAAGAVIGGWLIFYPLVLRKGKPILALVGVVVAIPVAIFANGWGVDRMMPPAIQKLNSRWDGSFLHHEPAEFLDQASAWIMKLNPKREAQRAVRSHLAIGGYLQRMGRVPEAIKHLERAYEITDVEGTKISEMHGEVARALGVAHLRAGEIASCLLRPNEDSCIFPIHGTGVWPIQTEAEKAEVYLREALELDPGDAGLRWLLALSQSVAGKYPTDVDVADLLPNSMIEGETTSPHFRNLAVELGVAGDDLAGSVSIDDFDNDGLLDIVTISYNPNDSVRYFHNNGEGAFDDWTERAGLTEQTGGLNITHADYNGDGLLDLMIIRGAWFLSDGYQRNSLLRQEQDGTFTDVTEEAGLAQGYPSLAAAWADYDLDGDLDLYLGNERLTAMGRGQGSGAAAAKAGQDERADHAPCELYRNNGDGTFTDVAEEAGVQNFRFTRGVAFGDYDNDGYPDLVLSNLSQPNRVYHNNGDGTFTDLVETPEFEFLKEPMRAFGSWWMDVNNDGNLDLFAAGYPLTDKVNDVIADRYGEERGRRVDPCALFLGDGKGGFTDVTTEWNFDRVHLVMGANFGDVDSDGWMDVYLGTGAPSLEIIIPNVLYRNVDGKQFLDATTASGLGHLHKGHGIAFGDMDNDGDLDTYAQLGGWYCDSHSQNAMFLNEGTENHSVTVKLVGTESNRFAIGARIKAVVEENGVRREIHVSNSGTGSFGCNPMEQHIGLGSAEVILELEVVWPNAKQTKQVFHNLPVDKTLRITEGEPEAEVVDEPVVSLMQQ